jgi:putative pre-16S rRNA nuclease
VRILGIDLGESRTGVAISDPDAITCSPLAVIRERDGDRLLLRVSAVADEYGVDEIVVGLPRPLAGGTNRQLEAALAFTKRLEDLTSARVVTWDERFTSKLADSGSHRSGEQDSVAACYILQNYLDWRSRD